MSAALAQLAAVLVGGGQPGRLLSRGQALRERAARAAACLRDSGDAELREMAGGLEAWAEAGGDLQALMGLRARRGRRDDLPANVSRKQARDEALRAAAERAAGADAGITAQIAALRALMACGAPGVRVLHEVGAPVPASDRQLRRILRGQ